MSLNHKTVRILTLPLVFPVLVFFYVLTWAFGVNPTGFRQLVSEYIEKGPGR